MGAIVPAVDERSESIDLGLPGFGASSNPASPLPEYRARQVSTVCRATPTRSAISLLPTPSTANSTIRARSANPARTLGARVNRSSSARLPSRGARAGAG